MRQQALAWLLVVGLLSAACSLAGGTLGGRQKCWAPTEPRVASLMRGTLHLDVMHSTLFTPEGETLAVDFPFLVVNVAPEGALKDSSGQVVANDGELVTVFGGLGSDGSMVVCAVEERHPS